MVFLYQITVFLQQNTTASLYELYFNDSMQTVYARCGGGGGSQQRGGRWGRCCILRHRVSDAVGMGLKIEIHEIYQNLRNTVSVNGPIIYETSLNQ